MTDKAAIQAKTQQLINMTSAFCDEYLDDEYKALCKHLIDRMSRKRGFSLDTEEPAVLAAAVIHSLGGINFQFDYDSDPHVSVDDIVQKFGTSRETVIRVSNLVRHSFKMDYEREFFTGRTKALGVLERLTEVLRRSARAGVTR